MHRTSIHFYKHLLAIDIPLKQILHERKDFHDVPKDWYIVMTDIVGSTEHFKAEHYQELNLVAVSSISIVLNIAKKHGTTVPFIYGGDGATLCIPSALVTDCVHQLTMLKKNSLKRFAMELRVCIIPVATVLDAGFPIHVAKMLVSEKYQQAVFLGDGIKYAESLMKHTAEYEVPKNIVPWNIDLEGLECNWNEMRPPRIDDEIVCLIIKPGENSSPTEVFTSVLGEIDSLYGSFRERHPIRAETLSPTTHIKTIIHASHLRHGRARFRYLFQHIVVALFHLATLWIKNRIMSIIDGEAMPDMTTSSDTLKIDDTLKTVFAGSPDKRRALIEWLDSQEKKKQFTYGIHTSIAAVMTCYIQEDDNMHVRFLDGFGGGYTRASIELKKKLAR